MRPNLDPHPCPQSGGIAAVSPPARSAPAYDLVDVADVPGGGQLHLVRVGADYEILVAGEQLMGSWSSRSEQALATLAHAALDRPADGVLIGGLGMGFTLAAALNILPPTASVTVAELVPEVLEWARGPLAHVHGTSLADPRVRVEMRDVHDVIDQADGRYDLILLDVDNGPDGLVTLSNERLYCAWGLRSARAALRPGGVLAIWSAYPDADFADRLRAADFDVSEAELDAAPDESAHTIWIATA